MTFDFLIDTCETERLKTLSDWSSFADADMEFRPATRIRTPHEHMVHQCVSEDNWMKNMLGIDGGTPALPPQETRFDFLRHYAAASGRRLAALRNKPEQWYQETAAFFNEPRSRSWIMLRRLTHSAHHRAQLTVYLRLPANKAPTIYRYESIDDLLEAKAEGDGSGHCLARERNRPPNGPERRQNE